jgi:hypothetical protein
MDDISREIAVKVLETVDAGLVAGLGRPVPGQMCVEAAVCYAMGLPHGDDPSCVAEALRAFKIRLNDSSWSSEAARAKGMRRLALVQLGSEGHLHEYRFAREVSRLALEAALKAELEHVTDPTLATRDVSGSVSFAVSAASNAVTLSVQGEHILAAHQAASSMVSLVEGATWNVDDIKAARDRGLSDFAETVVQLLVKLGVPGAQWLDLAPYEAHP